MEFQSHANGDKLSFSRNNLISFLKLKLKIILFDFFEFYEKIKQTVNI